MSSKGSRKLQLVILLVLVSLVGTMSIAYAVLSTTLNINGTAQVQDASWNVHFDSVQVNPYSVPINPIITDNNKITFSADLTTPGDFYKFTVDIVNEGSIDAMIESIAQVPELTTEQKKYLRYEVEYIDGTSINDSQLLKSGETKTISILFSYRNDIPVSDLPNTETDFDLEIVLVYVQADTSGVEISGNEKVVKVVSGDLNTVGSEICIGEECFYLISSDEDSVTMFAKYNLYVGGMAIGQDSWTEYGEEATGIQDSTMRGDVLDILGLNIRNGTLGYSTIDYWNDTSITYPQYVYNEQSSLYVYVENYKFYLQNLGVVVNDARLISYEELEGLGCSGSKFSCLVSEYDWIYYTSYCTGSAATAGKLWRITSTGYLNHGDFSFEYVRGVRPIIEISLTEF